MLKQQTVGPVCRGHDTDGRLQHEKDHERQCDHQAVGHWRSAPV